MRFLLILVFLIICASIVFGMIHHSRNTHPPTDQETPPEDQDRWPQYRGPR